MTGDTTAIEITEFSVDPSNHAAFEHAMNAALPILARQPGVCALRFGKVVEPGEGFALLVTWRSLSDHVEVFRRSGDFQIFVKRFRPLLARPARVIHLGPRSAIDERSA